MYCRLTDCEPVQGEGTLHTNGTTCIGNEDTLTGRPDLTKLFTSHASICLEGIAGTGKTTAAVAHLQTLLEAGVPGESILVIVPQRTLAEPYQTMLRASSRPAGAEVDVLTLGGLARRMVQLYWPLISEQAGFQHPERPPVFLTMELAQYFMAQIVGPMLDASPDKFTSIRIHRNRLYSQILDNLNKAAVVGLDPGSIGDRLVNAWTGDSAQVHVYEDAQACAQRFREACYRQNLLDYSLQVDLFRKVIWPLPLFQENVQGRYRHVIVDNIEEDTPVTHDLVLEMLPQMESALIIMDLEAGYRRFLGADPESACRVKTACDHVLRLADSHVLSEDHAALASSLSIALGGEGGRTTGDPRNVLRYASHRFQPEMLDWIVEEAARLIHEEDVPPGEIAVLSPFLSDALRFSLAERFRKKNIPTRSHRPSRALQDEPAARSLITLSRLAHSRWGIAPGRQEVIRTCADTIDGLDLVRAQLLVDALYHLEGRAGILEPFEVASGEVKQRVSFSVGERWDQLRSWLLAYHAAGESEFDVFLSRLFGELLSQRGFAFHDDYDSGALAANLIESVQKFRWVAAESLEQQGKSVGREYLELVNQGLVAAQYIRSWEQEEDAVLLAPAFTFLLRNKPIDVQFWVNIGSRGWSERLNQPLTHPYVLSRNWSPGRKWTDEDEVKAGRRMVRALSLGLIRRCRRSIYLAISEMSEQGFDQRGMLLQGMQKVFIESAQGGRHV